MSSYVVGALPFVSLLFMLVANRRYSCRCSRTHVGHYVLGYAIISWTLGFLSCAR